jgi:hypothetical protein
VSLIDDALKRAQSAQGASAAGPARSGHTPLPLPDARRGQRRRLGRYALFILVPLAAAAAVLLVVRRPEEERLSEPAALALPAPAATARPEPAEAAGITTRPAPEISREVFVPPPAEPRETAAQSPPPPVEEPAAPPMAPPPAPPPAAREVSDPAPRQSGVSVTRIEPPGPSMVASGSPMIVRAEEPPPPSRSQEARPGPPAARGRSYVREATAPSGARLTLDGIVFSAESPAAVINGRVVSVGSFVEGCEVVRIRPDRVELDDRGTSIVLLLK